jgi:hypothetical protein
MATAHPYRRPCPPSQPSESSTVDRGLAIVIVLVWVGSVVRALVAMARHESADRETALAVMLVFALPFTARLGSRRHAQ